LARGCARVERTVADNLLRERDHASRKSVFILSQYVATLRNTNQATRFPMDRFTTMLISATIALSISYATILTFLH
jgi:hypothetical protein